ncbi:30S ribosomal protein S9 [Anthocerotibacter panamensis]|uniref:30S ribosomal protein S9 n=1 Tax=Anthocerotibacter panamensis TaxID=2857077 RepID=UPI001C408285|nr:30S ribosomal protein S9 [Anthocerotibacter panamensis]
MSPVNTAVYMGTGRRKEAVARVRLMPGDGTMTINGVPGDLYLHYRQNLISFARQPLETLGLESAYDIIVTAHGGGVSGQAGAIRLGVARALLDQDPDNRVPLKREGHLTRDPRAVERKKYGLRKARKAKQYSKR